MDPTTSLILQSTLPSLIHLVMDLTDVACNLADEGREVPNIEELRAVRDSLRNLPRLPTTMPDSAGI